MKQKNEQLRKAILKSVRQQSQSDGFYDGRFKQKVVPDKRKQASRNMCRGKNRTDFSLFLCL